VSTLRDYLQVVRRRKWIIVAATLIVPIAAFAFSLQQRAMYQGSSQVLLSQQDLANQITGTQASSYNDPADRQAQTQANLARVPNVAARAIRALRLDITPTAFLDASSVTPGANADTLSFAVTNHDPQLASRMATAYANAYVAYRLQVETAPIEAARKGLEERLKTTPRGSLYNSLVDKDQTLAELEALKTSNASVIRDGGTAVQTAPKTTRNVVLGIVLGLFLGIGLAFLRETLDTRVRSAEAIAERLELPLLSRLPEPPKKLREINHLAMLDDPTGIQAEAFRMLRTNVEFAALGKDVQTVMVTSAVEREGKSTTIANLAVAMARAGQRVILVDLDLRRPFVDRFFDLREHVGLTQVAIGRVALNDALVPVSLDAPLVGRNGIASVVTGNGQVKIATNGLLNGHTNGNGNGDGRYTHGSLHVLPSGPIPPDPGEFVGTARLTEILEQLRDEADVVLIDAPPLFHVGDGLVLSAKVDAVIAVTRMEVVRRPMIAELKRLLDTMPATKLGFVLTGAESEESYGQGYGGYYYYRPYGPREGAEVQV
jgi:Mrp family chromosome partitioning ATPase/capsular polysaccharide biosynthesis protein